MARTAVALTYGGHTLAVTRDARGAWLDGRRIEPGGRARTTLPDGTWVIGGLLPEGAERAVVRDAGGVEAEAISGDGAWIATSRVPEPAVRFEVADGRVVAPTPLPGESPTDDAVDPCPACDEVAWASDGERVRCTRCGHEVHGWTGYADGTEPPDHEPVEPADAAASEEWARRTGLRLTLEELRDAPVFVVGDSTRHPRYAGGTTTNGRRTSVSVSHGDHVTITTHWRDEPDAADALNALRSVVHKEEPLPRASKAALWIRMDALERAVDRAVATAEQFTHEVEVERTAVAFDGLRAGAGWALVGRVAEASVVITGRGALPRRLRRVEDPAYELVGR